jgi:hypothetical protein
MKTPIAFLLAAALGGGFFAGGCTKKPTVMSQSPDRPEVAAQLKTFVAEKASQESRLAAADEAKLAGGYAQENHKLVLPDCGPFFAAAAQGDWQTVSNLLPELESGVFHPTGTNAYPHGMWLQTAKETYGAVEAFVADNEKYSAVFGQNIIESIPPGSIYFGGTDPGRFIVTAMCKSQPDADPFFTLTQNALADGSYLDYLRSMYGGKIYIPTAEDSQKCFQDYTEDVRRRQQNSQLKPGEDVQVNEGRVQVSGQVAVMSINGLLVKIIFDKNPDREFFVEESFPLDWMYPYLEPHGLIMKINRQPLAGLSEEIVQTDSDYWTRQVSPMIGGWLTADTTVKEIAAFAQKIWVQKDLSGFKGDPEFVQSDYAQKMFSKLRSSIAGLYAWRAQQATDAGAKARMNAAADFAFRQAWALCPYSPEAVYRYVNLLLSEGRRADALLVAETAAKMPPMQGVNGEQIRGLVTQLNQFQKQN